MVLEVPKGANFRKYFKKKYPDMPAAMSDEYGEWRQHNLAF